MSGERVNGVRISDSTVRRLSGYRRILGDLREQGDPTISSYELARRAGVTPAQVRKDLSFFGHFGKRGTGYGVAQLWTEIRTILGLDRRRVAALGRPRIDPSATAESHN